MTDARGRVTPEAIALPHIHMQGVAGLVTGAENWTTNDRPRGRLASQVRPIHVRWTTKDRSPPLTPALLVRLVAASLAIPALVSAGLIARWPEQWRDLLRVGLVIDLALAFALWQLWPRALGVARAWLGVSLVYLAAIAALWMSDPGEPIFVGSVFDPIVRFSHLESRLLFALFGIVSLTQLLLLLRADVTALFQDRASV